jgi:hypothetical protein
MYLDIKLECFENVPRFLLEKWIVFFGNWWHRTDQSAVGKCVSWMEVYLENTENAKGQVTECY